MRDLDFVILAWVIMLSAKLEDNKIIQNIYCLTAIAVLLAGMATRLGER